MRRARKACPISEKNCKMATTYIVTTLIDENDAGATVGTPGGTGLSLREAVALANTTAGDDTIVFHASLAGGTLRLTSTIEISAAETLTIDGDTNDNGTPNITITGDVGGDDTTIDGTSITNLADTAASELDDNVQDSVLGGEPHTRRTETHRRRHRLEQRSRRGSRCSQRHPDQFDCQRQ